MQGASQSPVRKRITTIEADTLAGVLQCQIPEALRDRTWRLEADSRSLPASVEEVALEPRLSEAEDAPPAWTSTWTPTETRPRFVRLRPPAPPRGE